jgi:thioredoxin reductase (NADPH)
VSIVIRGASLKETLSEYLADRIRAAPNVEVLAHTEVTALHGSNVLEAITVRNKDTGQERTRPDSLVIRLSSWCASHG